MRSRIGTPSPAFVLACFALLFSIAGGAYAATIAQKNTVATKSIKNNAVKTEKLADLAVTLEKMAADAITHEQVLDGSLKGADIDESSMAQVPTAAEAASAAALGGTPAGNFPKKSEIRVEGNVSSTAINDFTSATMTPLISKSFTAPASGFAFITAHVTAVDDNTLALSGHLAYRLRLDSTAVTTEAYQVDYDLFTAGANVIGNTGSAGAVVPITAGAHTVHLDGQELGTGSLIGARDISVLLVPSGSGVTIPVSP